MGRMVVVGKLLHPLFLEGDISKGWHVSSAVSAVASQPCVRLDVFLCLHVSLGLASHPLPQKHEGLLTELKYVGIFACDRKGCMVSMMSEVGKHTMSLKHEMQ